MKIKNAFLFIGLPALINLIFIAMYFVGNKTLQQWMAPTIPWLDENSWREFGVLEQLQNLYLLTILGLFISAVFIRDHVLERVFFACGVLFFVFLFLEEIDYGLHFYEYLRGEKTGIKVRNWHNKQTGGKQNVRYLKKAADIMMVIWFILVPLLKSKINNVWILALAPSKWFIGTFITAVMMSNLAHYLEDAGYSFINGETGNLVGNMTEFREASNYYLYLLYAIQLFKTRFDFLTTDNAG